MDLVKVPKSYSLQSYGELWRYGHHGCPTYWDRGSVKPPFTLGSMGFSANMLLLKWENRKGLRNPYNASIMGKGTLQQGHKPLQLSRGELRASASLGPCPPFCPTITTAPELLPSGPAACMGTTALSTQSL